MSSAEELKEELIATALPALTENVVVPFTGWSDTTNNNNIHPDVFYNATGCLRWEQTLRLKLDVVYFEVLRAKIKQKLHFQA